VTTIFTIGHSNHSADAFDSLLAKHGIELLIDVRTKPASRWYPHFNMGKLRQRLGDLNIQYEHFPGLGGHPPEKEFYDEDGRVVYERIAVTRVFKRDIKRAIEMSEGARLALMCAEGNPRDCHRHPFLARELDERGVEVLHICKDGSLEPANEMTDNTNQQMALFEGAGEDSTWRSPKRIRPRRHPSQ